MSSVLYKYKKTIQALNPLEESAFDYNINRWAKLSEEAKREVFQFEGDTISRKQVLDAFEGYYEGKTDYLFPFVMTMIWGFADTGYGTYRTNRYIGSEENRNLLKSAFQALKEGAQDVAFKELMKIKGLNISYVSKVLYFGTRARGIKEYALIFDIRVSRALVKVLDEDIAGLLELSPSNKYKDFENYNKLLHQWAKDLEVEAENIEMFLFDYEKIKLTLTVN